MKKNRYLVSTGILLLLLFNSGWISGIHAQKGWERMADMPTSRSVLKSVEHNGKVYVIGGDNPEKKYEKCNEVYDIETDSWSALASMDSPRVGHTLEILNNKIYVVGGVESVQQNFSNILEYDIETDTWTTICEMPEPRFNHFSEVIDGKIYISGGLTVKDGRHPGLVSSLRYDPANGRWDTIADLNTERHLGGSCIFDNKIYVFGGAPSGLPLPIAQRSIEIYDPQADVWTVSDEKIPVPFMYGIVTAHEDGILLMGGQERVLTAKSYSSVFKYLPTSSDDKWKVLAPMPVERARMYGNIANNYLHMFGGIVGFENAASMTDFSAIFPTHNHWRLNLDSLCEHVPIPDTAFLYALIEEGVDTNEDSLISYSEAESVTSLNVEEGFSELISDLTGIEAFKNLDSLNCSRNRIRSLDVTSCTKLKYLKCGDTYGYFGPQNQITNLDLTKNSELSHLDCSGNLIDSLVLSKNTALSYLACSGNNLISLDLSDNTALHYLDCSGNNLTSLDLSNNDSLEYLYLSENLLSNLDLSNNTWLVELNCVGNNLVSLDVSNMQELNKLSCSENQLSSLDLASCIALTELYCRENYLTSLNLAGCIALTGMDCSQNYLSNLDISKNTALTYILLNNILTLFEVCVWVIPFPTDAITFSSNGSPNICFQTDCNGDCSVVGIDGSLRMGSSIYPNPTNKILTIDTPYSGLYNIDIASLSGQLLLSNEAVRSKHQIDLSSFQEGVYYITIRSKDHISTRKILKL